MKAGNREDLFWLHAYDGEPPPILSMSARDLEHPDVLQIFLQLAEHGQFRLVVNSLRRPD
jgi:hypothetical protein